MVVIFIHQNFPAQYLHLARHLAAVPRNRVYFITQSGQSNLPRVIKLIYQPDPPKNGCHEYSEVFDAAVRTGLAVAEVCRRLRAGGIVPDLQALGSYLSEDRLHEQVYLSAAGPVSAHDMIFGHGAAIAGGRTSMAHRSGFTPGTLQRCFRHLPFAEVLLRRRGAQMELVALARASAAPDDATRVGLMNALGL